jgi:hypothetical protein
VPLESLRRSLLAHLVDWWSKRWWRWWRQWWWW